ncbi:hypothetical protein NL676_030213 [Syzygium grande]|nr:hypothetical protein NL676_030213 [Syzygium grande]
MGLLDSTQTAGTLQAEGCRSSALHVVRNSLSKVISNLGTAMRSGQERRQQLWSSRLQWLRLERKQYSSEVILRMVYIGSPPLTSLCQLSLVPSTYGINAWVMRHLIE